MGHRGNIDIVCWVAWLRICRADAVQQLLANWRRAKGKERDALLWGDEVEYLVVAVDGEAKKTRLSLAQADILKSLARDEASWKGGSLDID
jgi:glutamate--cysteine ligase catalytic subunit